MARLPRFNIPGYPQHIIQRGNNREPIFCDDQDRYFYLEKLDQAAKCFGASIHAYVLMGNHVHLLVTPNAKESISKTMQSLGRYYVQYFNHKYRRTGTLWEGRYKSCILDSETYLLTCSKYIELNPVRAKGMNVEHPAEYPWSSYSFNALGKADECLNVIPHELYLRLGTDRESRCKAYSDLFSVDVERKTAEEILAMTEKAWVLGDSYFRDKVEKIAGRRAQPSAKGGDRRSRAFKESFNRV